MTYVVLRRAQKELSALPEDPTVVSGIRFESSLENRGQTAQRSWQAGLDGGFEWVLIGSFMKSTTETVITVMHIGHRRDVYR